MKRVYLVRHGESEANVTHADVGPDSPLTLQGERQAAFLAQRFASIAIDVIIASPYLRTRETARIVNEVLRKPLEHNELFVEKRRPTRLHGIPNDIKDTAASPHFSDPLWKDSDEDSFVEIKERALAALRHLIERPEENILVVTHGWFLRVLIATQLFGETLTVDEYHRVWRYLFTRNTGITLVEYDPENINRGWRLITWNDHTHLGESN